MTTYTLDWQKYSTIARTAAAEGCVLLENKNNALPICSGETVSVFGRIQLDYFKSGTGSGGKVNVPYVRSILDGLALYPSITVYEPLLSLYRTWVQTHPFDNGHGWGTEPWCQEEMELTDAVVQDAAANSDLALIILGRTAGEDRDNSAQEGSYLLSSAERDMISKVCASFKRTAVVLNVGNIIDMSWVDEFSPSAVLYVWQGGMEGGYGAADVLCGAVSPCGKLSDTIARSIEDYPSTANFGSDTVNVYQEDIYVGYRYFETFAKDKVQYPFGYGLSYTTFDTAAEPVEYDLENTLTCTVSATVTNTGTCAGKEVIQAYICPPQGVLGKPVRNLVGFAKTKTLQPGESETLTIAFSAETYASYDDAGLTGCKSCFVLEAGEYEIFIGTDVRSAVSAGTFIIEETEIISDHNEAMAPVVPFRRMKPQFMEAADAKSTSYAVSLETAPLRTINPMDRRAAQLPSCLPYTGDKGYRLADVQKKHVSMEEFLAQLSEEDLFCLVRGEGMCSPKVTPGTAAAYGGVTESLRNFGIPTACCSDGPSGIRMDCGTSAFSLPNGTLLACTFNTDLVAELFEMEGLEVYSNQIDSLLGPGINIHRSPLNGRNFEYHSEDPYLTGVMAQAQLTAMARYNIAGTMKHFCANNQEYRRVFVEAVISERALREIYLKPYEIAVKYGQARSVMTTYGPINGIWTAGNYDLNTVILRDDWGFDGLVMTDWWSTMNDEGFAASKENLAAMVRAQNDVYMVTSDALTYKDNLHDSLLNNTLTRAELVRSAENICRFLLGTPAMQRLNGTYTKVTHINQPEDLTLMSYDTMRHYAMSDEISIPLDEISAESGSSFVIGLLIEEDGDYLFSLTASCTASELAQMSVTLKADAIILNTFTYHGSETAPVTNSKEKELRGTMHYLEFFVQGEVKLHTLDIKKL